MPLLYQHTISENTKLAIWKIEEPDTFFLQKVPAPPAISNLHKRLQHLAGRWLLQFLFQDFPYNEIIVADTRKPYLPYEQYHFSISHCGDYAAAIVSKNRRVGIDVEVPTEKVERIKHKFLHPEELRQLSAMSNQLAESFGQSAIGNQKTSVRKLSTVNRQLQTTNYKLLTLLWCAKEAVFKWWSYGGVDFSEHIRLQTFTVSDEGTINAYFQKTENKIDLKLHYKLLQDLCLVWVAE